MSDIVRHEEPHIYASLSKATTSRASVGAASCSSSRAPMIDLSLSLVRPKRGAETMVNPYGRPAGTRNRQSHRAGGAREGAGRPNAFETIQRAQERAVAEERRRQRERAERRAAAADAARREEDERRKTEDRERRNQEALELIRETAFLQVSTSSIMYGCVASIDHSTRHVRVSTSKSTS
mmetsp:Transcript_19845/g.40326  ORF Transcript_19845/g.40326 Transcript_19845/m.40326 type:complete len:180 (+) Transcript_19845:145-684(+)